MSFDDSTMNDYGAVLAGEITGQIMTSSFCGEAQLVLTVRFRGRLLNEQNPDAGVEPCSPYERDVYLTFSEDLQTLAIAVNNLRQCGYEGTC